MYRKKIYFIIFLLFTSTQLSYTQSNEEKGYTKSQYIISNIVSPTPLYGSNPRVTLGYIIQMKERWMYGLELGYANYSLLASDSRKRKGVDEEYVLFEIRPSIYYIINPNRRTKPYIAVELFYINQKDKFINDTERLRNVRYIFNGVNNPATAYDKADFSRIKYGVNFNIGFFGKLFKRFGYNSNIGLGIRNRNIEYSNIINPEDIDKSRKITFFTPIHLKETGNQLGLNFVFNVKLFYRIQ